MVTPYNPQAQPPPTDDIFYQQMLQGLLNPQFNPSQGYAIPPLHESVQDFFGPMDDQGAYLRWAGAYGNSQDSFSPDAFFAADPRIRGMLAEGVAAGGGDPIETYNYFQAEGTEEDPGFQQRLRDELGRSDWDQLVSEGDLGSIAAITSEERDDAAVDYYNRALEDWMAAAAPTAHRKLGEMDSVAERFGGRPYPGGQVPIPGTDDEGSMMIQEAVGDPLAQLASGGSAPTTAGQSDGGVDMTQPKLGDPDRAPMGLIVDLGEAQGDDRLMEAENDQLPGYGRIAVIGGRRYALSDQLIDQRGTAPAWRDAYNDVLMDRRVRWSDVMDQRERQNEATEQRRGLLSGLLDAMRAGTVIWGGPGS